MERTPKEIEIRTHSERPARIPMWILGISICFLAASGMVAIVRSIPASYASIPDEAALSNYEAAPSGPEDAHAKRPQAHSTVARAPISRRNRARCPNCGVIESTPQIAAVDVTGDAIAATAIAGKGYELKVRFRDGSTTVLTEASPRSWPSGSRVIVIGGLNPSAN